MSRSTNTRYARVRMALHQQQHRILLYTTCYNVLDGVTLTIRKLEQEILAAGHHVCILTTLSGDPANTNKVLSGVKSQYHKNRSVLFLDKVIPIPFVSENAEYTYQIGFALSRKVQRDIEAFEPTLVHITCPDPTALHLIAYARVKEIPLMGTYHSNFVEMMDHYQVPWSQHFLAAFFRHQYGFLQALYVPTQYVQGNLRLQPHQLDRCTNLQVWGRGVDVEQFHPSHRSLDFRRSTLGFQRNTAYIDDDDKSSVPIVLWVSRLVPEKRFDIFAAVIRRLHRQGVPFRAVVVGAGLPNAEEEAKALPQTTFVGWMDSDQVAVAYASSDIFLFPSAAETFGNVTLEAVASGLPVVVEKGCSGHLVRHGKSGFAVTDGDEDAFFQATLELVLNAPKRRAFSCQSRRLSLTMEKHAVLHEMLDNYAMVTDEFYTAYGGHHKNRDALYDQRKGAFIGGTNPRTLLLSLVETLIIVLLQFLERLCRFMQIISALQPASARTKTVASPVPSTISTSSCSMIGNNSCPREQEQQRKSMPNTGSDSSGGDYSVAELLDAEESCDSEPGIEQAGTVSWKSTDSETITTTSSTEVDSDSMTSCSTYESLHSSWKSLFAYCVAASHWLSKGCVRAILLQMRTESRLRNFCAGIDNTNRSLFQHQQQSERQSHFKDE